MVWVLVIVAAVVVGAVLLYNSLVSARNRVDEAWAQIDVQLRRRHDLVPNLVETVQAYARHERSVLEEVARARAEAVGASSVRGQAEAENHLDQALRSLFAVSEAYPELRASENFLELQRELTATEDRIAYSRQFYNASVQRYDTRRETFPTNMIAAWFRFQDRDYFEVAEDEVRRVPGTSF